MLVVIGFAGIWYAVSARKWFKGPKSRLPPRTWPRSSASSTSESKRYLVPRTHRVGRERAARKRRPLAPCPHLHSSTKKPATAHRVDTRRGHRAHRRLERQGRRALGGVSGGGITNHNYIVTVNGGWGNPGGGKYVLRVPGVGTDMFIDRDVERECMIEAARVGVAPEVAYAIEPEKAMADRLRRRACSRTPTRWPAIPSTSARPCETVRVFHDNAVFGHPDRRLPDAARLHQDRARDQAPPCPSASSRCCA